MPRLTPPRDASKVTFVTIGTTRRPAEEAGVVSAAARARRPLLGRLGVGAKLMLLVLLPVGVLLGFTIAASVDNWRTALSLRDFQNATEQSFAATDVAAAARRRAHGRRTCDSAPGRRRPSAAARGAGGRRRRARRGKRTGWRAGRNGRSRRSPRCGAAATERGAR